MAEHHLDHPGEWRWFGGYGPLPVLGDCPHDCEHNGISTIAYGPDFAHYELLECGIEGDGGCAGRCRGWLPVEPDGYREYHRLIEWKLVAVPAEAAS